MKTTLPDRAITPGVVFMAGEVVGYLVSVAYMLNFGPDGAASALVEFPSAGAAFIVAAVLAVVFEAHVYKRFTGLPPSADVEVMLAQHRRLSERLARAPWWHFLISALAGVFFGGAMAAAVRWAHA